MSILEKELSKIGTPAICPVIAIIKNQKILLGLRNYTPEKWKAISVWTCPGGRCDDGESVAMTLRRETAEETGITDVKIIAYIGNVPGAKEGDEVPLFLGETEQNPKLKEPEKFSEWRWVPLQEYFDGFPKNYINEKSRTMITDFLRKSLGTHD